MFEVAVTATVHTKVKDKTVFLVEAKQAGIFEIRNLPEDQMGPILGIADGYWCAALDPFRHRLGPQIADEHERTASLG